MIFKITYDHTNRLPNFKYWSYKRLIFIDINEDAMLLSIRNLNAQKADVWDNVSITMIKTCDKSLTFPWKIDL